MSEPGKRLSIGLDTAFDLVSKVGRDRTAVEREGTPDSVFNFVVTAHALGDWVQKDPVLSSTAKAAARDITREDEWLLACRDLANGSKHFSIDRYRPRVQHTKAGTGYGMGRYGAGPYGIGEWSITVSWDGATRPALDLVVRAHEVWAAFFRKHAPQGEPAA